MVGGMRVTPETVLGIYEVIVEEANRLRMSIRKFEREHKRMPELGKDPVSKPAADGFTATTEILLDKCRASVDGLDNVGRELADAARAYGKSEEQIKSAFDIAMDVPYVDSPAPGAV